MIDHINKFTSKGSGNYHFQVYYTSREVRCYTENENLPLTVVEVLVNGECQTTYTETGKIEVFTPVDRPKTVRTYIVTWDWLIAGRYRPQSKEIPAANAKAACQVIKDRYIPGETRFPFHVEAHRKEA